MMGGVPNRTVYLGGINMEATVKELCDVGSCLTPVVGAIASAHGILLPSQHVRGGILQNIKYLADKGIAFVTFAHPEGAQMFFQRCMAEGLTIHGKRIKIGWGKTQAMPSYVATALSSGATRNVYVGGVDLKEFPEAELRRDFEQYGEIEMISG